MTTAPDLVVAGDRGLSRKLRGTGRFRVVFDVASATELRELPASGQVRFPTAFVFAPGFEENLPGAGVPHLANELAAGGSTVLVHGFFAERGDLFDPAVIANAEPMAMPALLTTLGAPEPAGVVEPELQPEPPPEPWALPAAPPAEPVAHPRPMPMPHPGPVPVPHLGPVPMPHPGPGVMPQGEPVPMPRPEPMPVPQPGPVPEPEPEPEPESAAAPAAAADAGGEPSPGPGRARNAVEPPPDKLVAPTDRLVASGRAVRRDPPAPVPDSGRTPAEPAETEPAETSPVPDEPVPAPAMPDLPMPAPTVHDLPMPAPPESGPLDALPPGTDAPGSPLPVEAAIGVAVSVGKSLQPMHEEGSVHGHVHPGLILHGPGGPMLAGAPGPGAPPLADPGFAAPEVLRGEAATVAADVYGLGATLWSLLAGHPPFTADDPQDPASGRPVPHVPRDDVPEWLANVLARALAGEPAERYPTAHAFTDALEQGLRDGSAPPTDWENLTGWSWEDTAPEPDDTLGPEEAAFLAAPVTPSPRRRGSRKPVLAALAVLVLAVTAIGVTTLTAGSGTTEQRTRAESSPTNRTPPNPSPARTPGAQAPPAKPTQKPTSAPTSLRPVKDYVPGQVRIVDGRISIEVTWLDRSGGRATHYVVGGPSGHPPTTLGSAAPGTAKVTVTALNPSVDYCLTVVAVVDVDRVSQAKPVCTHRVQRRG